MPLRRVPGFGSLYQYLVSHGQHFVLAQTILFLAMFMSIMVIVGSGIVIYWLIDTRPIFVEVSEPYMYDPKAAFIEQYVPCLPNEKDCINEQKLVSVPPPQAIWKAGDKPAVWRGICVKDNNPAFIHRFFVDTVVVRLESARSHANFKTGCFRSGYPAPIPDSLTPGQWIYRVSVEHPQYNYIKKLEYKLRDVPLTITSNQVKENKDKIEEVEKKIKRLEGRQEQRLQSENNKKEIDRKKDDKWWLK